MAQHISRALAALAFTILIWGAAPAFIRSFSLALGPSDALVIRSVTAAALSLAVLPFFGGFRFKVQDLPRLAVISFIGMFGYFIGTIFGFTYVTAGVGGIIISTQPLLIALAAALLGAERLRLATLLGIALSFGGTLYLFGGGPMNGNHLIEGGLMIFGAGAAWALYVILSKPLIRRYGAFKITGTSLILGALPAFYFVTPQTFHAALNINREALFALFYLSVIGTLLTVSLWNYAAGHLRPTTVGSSLYLIPLLTILSGWLILGEPVAATTLVAGAIVLAGVALAQFGPLIKIRQTTHQEKSFGG